MPISRALRVIRRAKLVFRAADVLGERDGDVVGRLGDQRLDGVEDGQLLARLEVELRGSGVGALWVILILVS